jgi:putative Mg2+ transporter-C (MgtC) family protein
MGDYNLNILFFGKVVLSVALGAFIGLEREYKGHEAGIRTFGFIALGSCLFGLISANIGNGDPGRIAAQIVTGIGFLGGGIIIKDGGAVRGLTTATMVWCTSAIGLAVAFEFYAISIFTTAVGLILLSVPHLSPRLRSKKKNS